MIDIEEAFEKLIYRLRSLDYNILDVKATTRHDNSEGLIVTKSGKVIIPERSEDLKIRLCVIAHSGGNNGHLGYQAATRKLAEFC